MWRYALLLCLVGLVPAGWLPGQDAPAAALVQVRLGELPIIISAPHGGQLPVPGATPRQGLGLERRPGGFVTARDTGTEELARQVEAAIGERFGKPPYCVISLAHRRFLDPNREAKQAYEAEAAREVYETYHAGLARACRQVQMRFHVGLLLDLHGQGSDRETVFRGTKNGATVTLMRQRYGEAAVSGPASLLGLLKQRGWKVHPDPHHGREQAGFTGGFIVQHYGGDQGFGIDAVQLEFGAAYRSASARAETARILADALADYARLYLGWEGAGE